MKNKLYIITFILLSLLLFTGCGEKINKQIIGTYIYDITTLKINEDGSCKYTTYETLGMDKVFKVPKSKKLTSSVCDYKLDDNYIIITHNAMGYDVTNKYEMSNNYEVFSNIANNEVFYKKDSQSYLDYKEEEENDETEGFDDPTLIDTINSSYQFHSGTPDIYDWWNNVDIDICPNENLDVILKRLADKYNYVIEIYKKDPVLMKNSYDIIIYNSKGSYVHTNVNPNGTYNNFIGNSISKELVEGDDGKDLPSKIDINVTNFLCNGIIE